jgi:ABC-type amino acid transport system permease subunit
VTLPLMFRIVLPSLSNTFIGLFKDTSVAAALAVPEVTFVAQKVNQDTFRVIEAWSIAALIYLVVGYVLAICLRRVERRLQVVR